MNDQTIQLLIWKMIDDPDAFTMGELDDLTIALRERRLRK